MRGLKGIFFILSFAPVAVSGYAFDPYMPFSVVVDTACLFRDSLLTPPAVAGLGRGELLRVLKPGPENSLVRYGERLEGWVRNREIFWKDSGPGKIRMGAYWVGGLEMTGWTTWIDYMIMTPPWGDVPMDRTFRQELKDTGSAFR